MNRFDSDLTDRMIYRKAYNHMKKMKICDKIITTKGLIGFGRVLAPLEQI